LETYRIVAKVASECMAADLPLLVEALPCESERIPDAKDPMAMASAARLAFEHGADFIKTYYTGTPENFRVVVDNCPVPVLIAGGPRMDTIEETLGVVRGAMDAGAAGVVFGRNIWQNADPGGMVRALLSVIHDDAPVAEAMGHLSGSGG
jgi:DhnA family fructose-bisphosphate aldolase class Ia